MHFILTKVHKLVLNWQRNVEKNEKHSGNMPFLCLKQDYAKGKHGVVSNENNIKGLRASYSLCVVVVSRRPVMFSRFK